MSFEVGAPLKITDLLSSKFSDLPPSDSRVIMDKTVRMGELLLFASQTLNKAAAIKENFSRYCYQLLYSVERVSSYKLILLSPGWCLADRASGLVKRTIVDGNWAGRSRSVMLPCHRRLVLSVGGVVYRSRSLRICRSPLKTRVMIITL